MRPLPSPCPLHRFCGRGLASAERNIAEIKLLLHHPRRGSHIAVVDKEDGVHQDQEEQKFLVAPERQSKANSILRSPP
jgi:hypothetical protein